MKQDTSKFYNKKNMDALEKLVEAMQAYEEESGLQIRTVNIAKKGDPAGSGMNIYKATENDVIEPIDDDYLDELNFDVEPGDPNVAAPIMYPQAYPENINEVDKEYVKERVTDNIENLFPLSTNDRCNQDYEKDTLHPFVQDHLDEVRYHNKLMAYTVGQIAEATTSMLLEYNTQAMGHGLAMCKIVDNRDPYEDRKGSK